MKAFTFLTAIIVAGLFSAPAFASHRGEYSAEQLELTNTLFRLCAKDASKLLSKPHTQIVLGNYVGGLIPGGAATSYNFLFTQRMPAPSFRETSWQLNAQEVIKQRNIPVPDAPNRIVEVTCSVKKVDL